MTDKRDEDAAGLPDAEPTSGAGYGDHAPEPQESDAAGDGEEKSA